MTESSQNTFSIGNVLKSLQSLTNSVIDEFVRFSLRLHLSCWGAPRTIAFMKVFTIRLLHFAHKKCCFVNTLREYMRKKSACHIFQCRYLPNLLRNRCVYYTFASNSREL